MPRIALTILAFAAAMSTPVALATERMNDVEYLRAARCLAYVAGSDSHAIDADALAAEVSEQGRNRERYIRERARSEGRAIARAASRIDSALEQGAFDGERRAACDRLAPMIAGLEPRT